MLLLGYYSHHEWPKKVKWMDRAYDGNSCWKVLVMSRSVAWYEGSSMIMLLCRFKEVRWWCCYAGSRKLWATRTRKWWYSQALIPTTVLESTSPQLYNPCIQRSCTIWFSPGLCKTFMPETLQWPWFNSNQAVFDQFLDCPKPIIIGANGPAIGACVTSATLCDAIVASEQATFLTPFARLVVI